MNEFCSRVRKNTGNDNTLLFGLIADTHFEEKNNLAEYGANALAHMHAFAAAGKSCNARFLLHVGDMSNGNRPKVQSRREAALSAEALRSSGLPVQFVIGNHDDNTYFRSGMAKSCSTGRVAGRSNCCSRSQQLLLSGFSGPESTIVDSERH